MDRAPDTPSALTLTRQVLSQGFPLAALTGQHVTRLIPFPYRAAPAGADAVRVAYDALAPAYDAFTAGLRDDDVWLAELELIAQSHGLGGRRVLDVACGTGASFIPLLERGYAVTACDVSPEMVRRAVGKAPDAAVLIADMRVLPALGQFDLVTCLEDAFNCLLHAGDVRAALQGIARSLAPGGLAVWDVNTLELIRTCFSCDWVADRGEWFLAWHGTGSRDLGLGGVAEARIDAFRHRGATWLRSTSRHRQRHWPIPEITRLAHEAGLEVLEVLGQPRAGVELVSGVDEGEHFKAVFVARRA
jgi:SAM-dependent methyltransferase